MILRFFQARRIEDDSIRQGVEHAQFASRKVIVGDARQEGEFDGAGESDLLLFVLRLVVFVDDFQNLAWLPLGDAPAEDEADRQQFDAALPNLGSEPAQEGFPAWAPVLLS